MMTGVMAGINAVCSQLVGKQGLHLAGRANMNSNVKLEGTEYKNIGRPVVSTRYNVEVRASDGTLKWADEFDNLVTAEGLDKLLDATFKTGLAEPEWYVGMVSDTGAPEYSVEDTMLTHAGWTEFADVSEGTRQLFVPGTIGGGDLDNVQSRAVYHITQPGAVVGCFLADDDVIGGTGGLLYGVGGFTGGGRDVEEGDILRIAATLSVAAAEE
jgi:hypothetical protein